MKTYGLLELKMWDIVNENAHVICMYLKFMHMHNMQISISYLCGYHDGTMLEMIDFLYYAYLSFKFSDPSYTSQGL